MVLHSTSAICTHSSSGSDSCTEAKSLYMRRHTISPEGFFTRISPLRNGFFSYVYINIWFGNLPYGIAPEAGIEPAIYALAFPDAPSARACIEVCKCNRCHLADVAPYAHHLYECGERQVFTHLGKGHALCKLVYRIGVGRKRVLA